MKKTTGFIPKKYTPIVMSFYFAGIMAFLMSAVLVAINAGVTEKYLFMVLRSYLIAFPIAFICAVLV